MIQRDPVSTVLVVGGGVGGMRAAIDLAEAGLKVYLVENMPWLLQRMANFVPIKHWLIILRDILLKGAGVDIFWKELVSLAALGLVINIATILFLRRRLE